VGAERLCVLDSRDSGEKNLVFVRNQTAFNQSLARPGCLVKRSEKSHTKTGGRTVGFKKE